MTYSNLAYITQAGVICLKNRIFYRHLTSVGVEHTQKKTITFGIYLIYTLIIQISTINNPPHGHYHFRHDLVYDTIYNY